MIIERYIEYLALLASYVPDNSLINYDKLHARLTELEREILEPYVINSDSKE